MLLNPTVGLCRACSHEPIDVGSMEAAKEEVAKLSPGAVRSRGYDDEIRPRHCARVSKLAKARGIQIPRDCHSG